MAQLETPCFNRIKPEVALALSGGGGRGLAQIGVLLELERAGIEISDVAGTSIGAIIGGMYSSGYTPEQIERIALNADWNWIFSLSEEDNRDNLFLDQKRIADRSLVTLRFYNYKYVMPQAISIGSKLNSFLQKTFWNALYQNENFDSLKYRFRAVATDLNSGKSMALKEGSLATAVRASATVPLRYSPVRIDSMLLVDGGILANIPTDCAAEFNPDMIIAVNSTSPLLSLSELETPWNIADQAISVAMANISSESRTKVDFLITPNIEAHRFTNFTETARLIERGAEACRQALPGIKSRYKRLRDSIISARYLRAFDSAVSSFGDLPIRLATMGFEPRDSVAISNSFQSYSKRPLSGALLASLAGINQYSSLSVALRKLPGELELSVVGHPYPILDSVKLCGAKSERVRKLVDTLNNRRRSMRLSPELQTAISEEILATYRASGYSMAAIERSEVDPKNGVLTLYVDEAIIHNVIIKGNDNTNSLLIKRELRIAPGQPLNADNIIKSRENLIDAELFNNVEIIVFRRGADKGTDVVVKVSETGTTFIRVGARLDNERKLQAGVDLTQENLFNFGTRAGLRVAGGVRNFGVGGWIENSRIFNTLITNSINLYFDRCDLYSFRIRRHSDRRYSSEISGENRIDRIGARVSLGSQLERNGRVGAEYRYELQRYYDVGASSLPNYYGISTVKFVTIFDNEDRMDFPTKGRVIDLGLETSLIGSDIGRSFSKMHFAFHTNLSLGSHTLIPSLFFGGADKTLPEAEFFRMGGERSFYGVREDEYFGRQAIRASTEYRYKLPFKIFFDAYVSGRYDVGAAWLSPERIKVSELRHGIGAGIAFDTPLGPANFSLGKSFFFSERTAGAVWGDIVGYFSVGMRL